MENREHLQELMTNIVDIFGKEIITENRFVNLLADYRAFDGNNDARRILNAIVAGRYAKLLVNMTTSQLDLPRLKYFANELAESDGFHEEKVETVMRMVVFACNKVNQDDADYSIIKQEDKYGCINSKGDIIIPFEYDKMRDFNSDFGTYIVCVKNFECGDVYTTLGELVFSGGANIGLTNEDGLWRVEKNNKYGLIHPNGEIVVPFEYKSIVTVNPGTDIRLLVVETENRMFGVLDYMGHQVLPPVFESIPNFISDTFEIIEAKLSGRYMYFNLDGSVAEISPLFCTTPFTAYTYNQNDHKMPKGYIVNGAKLIVSTTHGDITDVNGKILCNLGPFNDGLAVAKEDNLWIGYMNESLEWIIRQFRHDPDALFDLCEPFSNGLAIVWKGDKRGLINVEGKMVASPQYENIIIRDWCLILRYAEKPIHTIFTDSYLVGDSYIMPYKQKNKFTCIMNGIYDIGNFSNNRTFAQYRNFVGIVTSDGKSIEPLEYEWHRSWNSPKLHEANVISPVRRNGLWGGLDLDKGFMPFNQDAQNRNEQRYLAKHQETSTPIPYFNEYQKEEEPCGFKWSNLYHIPVRLYSDFIRLSITMTNAQRLQWLKSNSVTQLN